MFLIVSVLLGVAIGYATGGRLSHLARLRLRATWLVLLALLVQLLIFPLFTDRPLLPYATTSLHLSSYALVFLFLALNWRQWALLLTGVGAGLNLIAIAANRGYMPASPTALARAGKAEAAGRLAAEGVYGNVCAMGEGTRLDVLGDWLYLPQGVPLATAFSLGDLLIGIGLVGLIVWGMRARGG